MLLVICFIVTQKLSEWCIIAIKLKDNFVSTGHREISDTVPDIQRACNEYQFDDEMESTDGVFATLTKKRSKARRAINTLTYDDVFWASKIENPLVRKTLLAAAYYSLTS